MKLKGKGRFDNKILVAEVKNVPIFDMFICIISIPQKILVFSEETH